MKFSKIAGYSIFGIFTIKVAAFFAISTISMILFSIIKILKNPFISKVDVILPLIILSYVIFGGLIASSFEFKFLLMVEFWQGEGRFMLSMIMSIMILILMKNQIVNIDNIIKVMSVMTLIFLIFWAAGFNFFSVARLDHFGGLLTSHSGAGMFYGCLFIFTFCRFSEGVIWKFFTFVFFIAMILTASRLTVVALLGAFFIVFFLNKNAWQVKNFIKGLIILSLSIYSVSFTDLADRFMPLFDPQTYDDIFRVLQIDYVPGEETNHGGQAHNILQRIIYWNYAFERAAISPLWGTGFGTFNDNYEQIILGFHISTFQRLDLGNAHNTFLHILSENGILGLILVLYFYTKAIFANSNNKRNKLLYWHLILSGCFSHALGAPSVIIPTLVLALSADIKK